MRPDKEKERQPLIAELEKLKNRIIGYESAEKRWNRIEKELVESERKYRLLADNVADVIWLFDLEKERFTYVSPSIERLRGISPEKALKSQDALKDFLPPESRQRFSGIVSDELLKRKSDGRYASKPICFEQKEYGRGGSVIWVELTANILFDENGKPAQVLGVSRDATGRKIAEEALKKAHAELEEKVRQRTAYLDEANIALKVLLNKRDQDRKELEEKIMINFRELIVPMLEKLKKICHKEPQKAYLEILESNVNDIFSPLLKGLSSGYIRLSPMENQVAHLVKQGKRTKEIGEILHVSDKTIEFHRDNIRKKVGIKKRKINLRTYLESVGTIS